MEPTAIVWDLETGAAQTMVLLLRIHSQGEHRIVAITTLDGALTDVGTADIAALKTGLRGGLLLSGDEGYEGARRVWNGNIDRAVHRTG